MFDTKLKVHYWVKGHKYNYSEREAWRVNQSWWAQMYGCNVEYVACPLQDWVCVSTS